MILGFVGLTESLAEAGVILIGLAVMVCGWRRRQVKKRLTGKFLGTILITLTSLVMFGFGVLAHSLLEVVVAVLGLTIALHGWKRRQLPMKLAGTSMIMLVVLEIFIGNWFVFQVESNPLIRSDAEILGTYSGKHLTVSILPDGTCIYDEYSIKKTGIWSRDDWNLLLSGTNLSVQMRFIQFRGKYRLQEDNGRDPDEIAWWEIGLKRTNTK